jgi:hypothetical protein
MRYRKLRIAWSVAWGVVAVLLIVLWVRSYWEIDKYGKQLPDANGFALLSRSGAVYCAIGDQEFAMDLDVTWRFILTRISVAEAVAERTTSRHFVIANDSMITIVRVPDLCLLGLTTALVAAPWLRSRFSLRTLLIATTLLAVVLGLIVWL